MSKTKLSRLDRFFAWLSLDRFFAWLSPELALKRERARRVLEALQRDPDAYKRLVLRRASPRVPPAAAFVERLRRRFSEW